MRIVKYILALALAMTMFHPTQEVQAMPQPDNLMCKLITGLVTSGRISSVPGQTAGTFRLAVRESALMADVEAALLTNGFTASTDGFLYSKDGMTDTALLALFCPPTNPPTYQSQMPAMIIVFGAFALLALLLLLAARRRLVFSH